MFVNLFCYYYYHHHYFRQELCPATRWDSPFSGNRGADLIVAAAKSASFAFSSLESDLSPGSPLLGDRVRLHYLSNAAFLIWPHLFYTCFVVSRIAVICQIVRHF